MEYSLFLPLSIFAVYFHFPTVYGQIQGCRFCGGPFSCPPASFSPFFPLDTACPLQV
ncbi:hypothetical protein CLOM621_07115 [Clostridium sp. M62/1]|nr:hypothetical protein CLOM621_07115 [Clostridium sp. M62/1]